MPTKADLIKENERLYAALDKIDDQWNKWSWLSGPESAAIASKALRRPVTTGFHPGSILYGKRRTNFCLVYAGPRGGSKIVPGSVMRRAHTVDEKRSFRRQLESQ